jgi:probable F420-dependent oxidoreductase
MRKFRFGVTGRGRTRAEWQEFARKAEDLGFSTLMITDHLGPQLAPLAALMSAADATSHLRVGTVVLDNDFRHPAILAKEAATIDLLTDGRLELGMGAGWHVADYDQSGIPFDSPSIRYQRLMESVRIIKAAFGETPVTLHGVHYQVDNLNILPKPLQLPHPPILIGARGRGMLTFAAHEADIVGLYDHQWAARETHLPTIPIADCGAQVDIVRMAAGHRYPQVELSIYLARLEITAQRAAAADRLAAELNWTPEGVLESSSILLGSADAIVDTLQERRERFDVSYLIAGSSVQAIDAFAPVVQRLAGT